MNVTVVDGDLLDQNVDSIIHVAGIIMLGRSSEPAIRDSVRNAMAIARDRRYQSIAMPLIGAGSGGGKPDTIQTMILDGLTKCQFEGEVVVVRYCKTPTNNSMHPSRGIG